MWKEKGERGGEGQGKEEKERERTGSERLDVFLEVDLLVPAPTM